MVLPCPRLYSFCKLNFTTLINNILRITKKVKSKGLVISGIVLIGVSMLFVLNFSFLFGDKFLIPLSTASIGPIKITDVTERTAAQLVVFGILFLTGARLLVTGFV